MKQGVIWDFELRPKGFDAVQRNFNMIDKNVDMMEGNVTSSMNKIDRAANKTGSNLKSNFREAANEIPGFTRVMNLARNPIVLAGVATIGLIGAINKGTQAAKVFNHEFLELEQLNLGKSQAQIDQLKDSVLDVSFDKGLDPLKTSRAFFDIQSATGKYGEEVAQLTGRLGEFSQVTKADFNTTVEGASKAMGIFGFGAQELDGYLASSFKTVQVGITTFDQLAKVQTEFGGAAAAAGQNYDQANKLFAVFTKTAKSQDIAANLTKTAFQDLGKKSTVDNLKKLGVNIFDADGKMRGLEDITAKLIPKLKGLNDEDFARLKANIGGSEGIKSLLDQLKNSGDGVLDTFKAFDETEFNFDKAIANARGDLETMSEIVDNKLTVAWTRFGDKVAPVMNDIKSGFADLLDNIGTGINDTYQGFRRVHYEDELKAENKSIGSNKADDFLRSEIARVFSIKNKDERNIAFSGLRESITGKVKSFGEETIKTNRLSGFEQHSAFLDKLKGNASKLLSGNRKDQLDVLEAFGVNRKTGELINQTSDVTAEKGIGRLVSSSSRKSGGIRGVSGSGERVRNVTVTFEKLVENVNISNFESEGGQADLTDEVTKVLVRAVRDAEIGLSSD